MKRIISAFAASAYVLAVGTALFVASAQPSFADPSTAFLPIDIQTLVEAKTQQSGEGVVLAISKRGESAAQTAYLLATQARSNHGYAPLLIVAEDKVLASQLSSLGLTAEQLPALVFFNRNGNEVSRVVLAEGTRPMNGARLAYLQSVSHKTPHQGD